MTYTLPTTEDKSNYVEEKFDEIAQKYDRFNDVITFGMHRYWKKFVVRQTGLRPDEECLDLCCGTGDISREILRQHPECKITGLDFSAEMLKIAKSKNSVNSEIQYLQGDAMNIPFPDKFFDAVTMGYGLRNVSKINICLEEIIRVLKPGGWGILQVPLWSDLTFEDPKVSPEEYELVYGHPQHVRRYGRDYLGRLESVGFKVELDKYATSLTNDFVKKYGILKSEDIYLCKKSK